MAVDAGLDLQLGSYVVMGLHVYSVLRRPAEVAVESGP